MVKRHRLPYRLYKRGEIYHAYFSFKDEEGTRIQFRESTGAFSLDIAERYCIRRIADFKEQESSTIEYTLNQAFGRYMLEKEDDISAPKDVLGRLEKMLQSIGNIKFHELNEDNITYHITRRKRKVKNSTINRELTDLNSVINHLRKVSKKILLPDVNISSLKLSEPAPKTTYLKDWKSVEKIIKNTAKHLQSIIYTALYTGFRKMNILHLKWSEVDLENMIITVKVKDKNKIGGKTHTIPIITPMLDILKKIKDENSRNEKEYDYVFIYRGRSISSISRAWKSIFYEKKRGTDYYLKDKGGNYILKDKSLPYIRFHDLRHTSATWLLKKTGNIKIVKDILGHANIKTTERYAHVDTEQKENALNAVFAQNLHKPTIKDD